jgi:hypothetical protein
MYKFLSKKIDQPCSSNGVMREERRKREPSRDREREREREKRSKEKKEECSSLSGEVGQPPSPLL